MKKKLVCILCAVVLMLQSTSAMAIYKNEEKYEIAEGIVRTSVTQFDGGAWITYHTISVDLTAPNVSLSVLTSKNGVSYLDNVIDMAKDTDVVAAINADFFDTTIGGGRSSMLGMTMQDGILTSSASTDPGLATMVQLDDGEILFDYFKTFLYAFTEDGISQEIMYVNKFHNLAALSMYTPAFGEYSRGSEGDMIELVCVWEDKDTATVTEKHLNEPQVKIPENGFVLRTNNSINGYLNDNFEVGDTIKITMDILPDEGKIKEAVGGGTLLVKDGVQAEFTNIISGTHPRSAIGVSEDGKTLYLVAVDGRGAYSQGMTQEALSEFMISIGAYNAINLDGGGSTTMVERDLYNGGLTVTNTPSDGGLRKVINSVGISSTYDGNLKGLSVRADKDAAFKNMPQKLQVMGLDKYKNPVVLPPDAKIEWSVEGVDGEFTGNTFVAHTAGTAEITASYRGISQKTEVEIYDEVFGLVPSARDFTLGIGASQAVTFKGYDAQGRWADIPAGEVSFDSDNLAEFKDGKIIAKTKGYGTGVFSIGEINCYVTLKAGPVTSIEADDFEVPNASFLGYPEDVTGSFEYTQNKEIAKTQLGLLSFEFNKKVQTEIASEEANEENTGIVPQEEENKDKTSAAYIVFDEPKEIPENAIGIKLLVHSEKKLPVAVKAYIQDKDENIHYITLAEQLNQTGWKTLSASLPDELAGGRLLRIYTVATGEEEIEGSVYFDDLSFDLSIEIDRPKDITKKDARNVSTSVSPGGFEFYVMATNNSFDTLLNKQAQAKLQDKFTPDTAYGVYVGRFAEQCNTTKIQADKLARLDDTSATFITLGATFNKTTWNYLKDNLDTTEKNVFITINKKMTEQEKLVMHSLLSEHAEKGHNIMVFYSGDNEFYINGGVRYFGLLNTETVTGKKVSEKLLKTEAIRVCVNPDKTTYEFVPIM